MIFLSLAVFAFFFPQLTTRTPLQQQLDAIAADAKGTVSFDCSLPGTPLSCDLYRRGKPPMQSVFKLPAVITALHLVETGRFSLDQPIRFLPSDRILPTTYSPLQDKYPAADVDVPLRELLRLAVSYSDNAAADTVLRIIGGPGELTKYMNSLGVKGFHQEDSEAALHRNVAAQYKNWFQPESAVYLLRKLADRSPLNKEHTATLFTWMKDSPTGMHRIKGLLPAQTVVFHKTGTSGVHNGLAHATNDIGLITMPDGRLLALAVFVTDSRADEATREAVIARIAKAIYDAALKQHK